MIQLIPFEETTVGKELIQQGKELAMQQNYEKAVRTGALIGQLQVIHRLLKRYLKPNDSLTEELLEELGAAVEKLEAEMLDGVIDGS